MHHRLNKFDIIFDTGSLSPVDFSTMQTHAQSFLMNGQWAGEECITAAADFLKTGIHLYVFVANISPIVHSPATDSARHQPIALVSYEPGHYSSVSSSSCRVSLDALSTSLSSATRSEPTGEQSLSASSSVSSCNAPFDVPPPSSPSSTSSFSPSASPFVQASSSLQCSTSHCVQSASVSYGASHTSQLSEPSVAAVLLGNGSFPVT